MKKLFLILATLFATTAALANPYQVKVLRVIDGDTIEIEAPYLPVELKQKLSIRILGVDTPEKAPRAKCLEEAGLAQRASLHTKRLVGNAKQVEVDIVDWDKYGGRILGNVRVDGVDLGTSLISNELARPYHGEKKQSWCE